MVSAAKALRRAQEALKGLALPIAKCHKCIEGRVIANEICAPEPLSPRLPCWRSAKRKYRMICVNRRRKELSGGFQKRTVLAAPRFLLAGFEADAIDIEAVDRNLPLPEAGR